MTTMKNNFGYDISYAKAWHAKQKVIENLFGSHEAAFPKLPRLLNALQLSNPGTVVHWKHKKEENGEATFGFVFWAFGAAIQGFQWCRPLISIDATHLYGKYQGKLLIGVAYDANNQLFPLCFAFADSEFKESWGLFLQCLRYYVTGVNREICLLSDRHASIHHAVKEQFPEPLGHHRYCSRHLASNFNTHFKSQILKKQFKNLAACPNKAQFDLWYENFCNMGTNGEYKRWIEKIPKSKWALAYDEGHRYGMMTTNLVEIFNGVLKGVRGLPLTAIVMATYFKTNTYFVDRRELGQSCLGSEFAVPIEVEKRIRASITQATATIEKRLFNRNMGTYRVQTQNKKTDAGFVRGGSYEVILGNWSCSCGEWKLYGMPCLHVCACCDDSAQIKSWISPYLTAEYYTSSYAPFLHPLPDESYWPEWNGPTVMGDPARLITKRGRRVSTRIHNEMDAREGRASIRCSRCHQTGHNRRSCTSVFGS